MSRGWCGASRLLRALAQRTWGAAEICRNAPLLERLGDPRSETTAQEWRFAIVQVQHALLLSLAAVLHKELKNNFVHEMSTILSSQSRRRMGPLDIGVPHLQNINVSEGWGVCLG